MQIGSRLFIKGNYRLAYKKDKELGYIKLNYILFNITRIYNK
jgi:hypothetical protein